MCVGKRALFFERFRAFFGRQQSDFCFVSLRVSFQVPSTCLTYIADGAFGAYLATRLDFEERDALISSALSSDSGREKFHFWQTFFLLLRLKKISRQLLAVSRKKMIVKKMSLKDDFPIWSKKCPKISVVEKSVKDFEMKDEKRNSFFSLS